MTHDKRLRLVIPFLAVAVLAVAGCGGSMSTSTIQSANSGPVFVVGTDAPLASVTSFSAQINSLVLTGSGGSTPSLISGSPVVDFARFNGLQTLLDMNSVPAGTYTGVTITLGPATIGYLNTSTTRPSISTQAATLTNSTVNITLNKPLVVAAGGAPAGLRVDFDLAQSIQVDGSGNFTGNVNPTFDVRTVARTDAGAHIDEIIAGVLSVNASGQSFVVQGPHGQQFTVKVDGNTEWDGNATLSTLTTSSIVQVSGQLDAADQTLDADEVALLTDTGFFATGQLTYVTPSSGPATSVDLYVRSLEPTNTGLTLGQIATINLTGNEKYFIYWMHNPFTQFLFNSSALMAGQTVAVGGPATGAVNANNVTVNRVHLRNWGFNGTIVPGSQNTSNGTFQMKIDGFAGVLVPQNVTVYLGQDSDFRYGMGKFGDLTNSTHIRVVGLLLKNPSNGQIVLMARHVDGFNHTDFATFPF
jgi:hypothetical protein